MSLDWRQLAPVLIVAAHPDDETIGLGGQFGLLPDAYILHVTDGAPRSSPSRSEYAAIRKSELDAAMDVAGIDIGRRLSLGCVDQEASFSLCELTRLLCERMRAIQPRVVVTHPYEGGHPDHDSAAFLVQTAAEMIGSPPLRVEFTSYHNGAPHSAESVLLAGQFLPGPPDSAVSLGPEDRERKQRMFACFKSQEQMLGNFSTTVERFRRAPHYDFSAPPHSGNLFYEDKNWGVSGDEWRRLARQSFY